MAMLLAVFFVFLGFVGNLFRRKARYEEHRELAISWSYITFVSMEFAGGASSASFLSGSIPLPVLVVATLGGALVVVLVVYWAGSKRTADAS